MSRGPNAMPHGWWTKRRDWQLLQLVADRVPYTVMAERMGVTEMAIRQRVHVLNAPLSRANGLTAGAVERLLGLGESVAHGWFERGLLPTVDAGYRCFRGRVRVVRRDVLHAWLADEASWPWWTPERITDPLLRAWACELRAGKRFLLPREAGERLGVSHYRVNQLIRTGRLRAAKGNAGSTWLIREDWLAEDAPRCADQRRPGQRRRPDLTDRDTALIRRWWGQRTGVWLAEQIGCSAGAVYTAAYRMGLPRLGRGDDKRARRWAGLAEQGQAA